MDDKLFNFEKSVKNLSVVDNRIHKIIDEYKPPRETEYEDKKDSLAI